MNGLYDTGEEGGWFCRRRVKAFTAGGGEKGPSSPTGTPQAALRGIGKDTCMMFT